MGYPVILPLIGSIVHIVYIDSEEYKNLASVVRNFYACPISEEIMNYVISMNCYIQSPGDVQRYDMVLDMYQKGSNPTYGDLLGRIPTKYGQVKNRTGGINFI